MLLIGIDDTDNAEPGCVGTGKLARRLARELGEAGLVAGTDVTRHQLLVHPEIPFTSHNSSACILAREARAPLAKIAERARDFVLAHPNAGANPGLCVMEEAAVPSFLLDFAKRAQLEVLCLDEADGVAARLDAVTWWSGETGQGRIGAMAAVGLRSTGNDGRFIGLAGIRDLEGVLAVGEIVARSPIAWVETLAGERLPDDTRVDTRGWVRPSLRGGEPVLRVRCEEECWIPEEKWKTCK